MTDEFPVGVRVYETTTGDEGTVVMQGRGSIRVRFDGDDIDNEFYLESHRDGDVETWVFPTLRRLS